MTPRPYGLLAELTHRCPLHCPYCSNPLELARREEEMPVTVWSRVLREAAALGVLQVGFSGGEPLLYPGLSDLVRTAREEGLYSNLITSAVGLTPDRARDLAACGLDTIQISFQAEEAGLADDIAGARTHASKLAGARTATEAGLPLGINIVLHRRNIDQLADLIRFAESLGAVRLELANVQFYGWAFQNRSALLPTLAQVQTADAIALQEGHRLRGRMQIAYVLPDYYERRPKPCLHGWGMRALTVDPRGDVLPCQAARAIPELTFANVQSASLEDIWRDSEAFNRFRGTEWLPEPCATCEFREIDFGGCRCQAALLTGDAARTDPVCEFSPDRPLVDAILGMPDPDPAWVYRG